MNSVDETSGAVDVITSRLGDRVHDIVATGITLKEQVQHQRGLTRLISTITARVSEQSTELEQDLISLAMAVEFLQNELDLAVYAGRPTGRIDLALRSAQELDAHLRSAITAITALNESIGPVHQESDSLTWALARLADTSDALAQQINSVRDDSHETRGLIVAISEE